MRSRTSTEQELERLAYTDRLTGFYSRDGLVRVLEQRLRDEGWASQGCVVAIDVSALRNVNEAYGYAVGDTLLTAIGERLDARAGPAGLVARTGGGAFAVFLPSVTPTRTMTRTLLGSDDGRFAEPFQVSGRDLRIFAHLGYTELGREPRDVESLLREAEIALHAARRGSEANGRTYTRELRDATTARVELAHELGTALEEGELALHYQPKVDLASGHLVSAEALVRWNHPRDGLLMPGAFIDVAERSGLIAPMGRWVLHEACRALRSWQDEGLDIVRVAINVSVEQLRFGRFADEVQRALEQHGVEPPGLTLEITETVFLHESELLRAQLRELHDLGVHISLDDFGTGFASLAYLRNYPFDKIKIDRTFVRGLPGDPYGRSIVTTVLGIAASIGAETIAEGIETAAQRDALLELGCRVGQGYYDSKPVEQDVFRELLTRRLALPIGASP